MDTRSDLTEIRTHNGALHEAVAASTSDEVLERVEQTTDLVAIEEHQETRESYEARCLPPLPRTLKAFRC